MAGQLVGSTQLCWISGNGCTFAHTIPSLFSVLFPSVFSTPPGQPIFVCLSRLSLRAMRKSLILVSTSQPGLDVPPVGSNKVLINPPRENSSPYRRITCDLFPSGSGNCLVPSRVYGSQKAINKLLIEWQMMGLEQKYPAKYPHGQKCGSMGGIFPFPSEFIADKNIGLCI